METLTTNGLNALSQCRKKCYEGPRNIFKKTNITYTLTYIYMIEQVLTQREQMQTQGNSGKLSIKEQLITNILVMNTFYYSLTLGTTQRYMSGTEGMVTV